MSLGRGAIAVLSSVLRFYSWTIVHWFDISNRPSMYTKDFLVSILCFNSNDTSFKLILPSSPLLETCMTTGVTYGTLKQGFITRISQHLVITLVSLFVFIVSTKVLHNIVDDSSISDVYLECSNTIELHLCPCVLTTAAEGREVLTDGLLFRERLRGYSMKLIVFNCSLELNLQEATKFLPPNFRIC